MSLIDTKQTHSKFRRKCFVSKVNYLSVITLLNGFIFIINLNTSTYLRKKLVYNITDFNKLYFQVIHEIFELITIFLNSGDRRKTEILTISS